MKKIQSSNWKLAASFAVGILVTLAVITVTSKPTVASLSGSIAYNCKLSGGSVESGRCIYPIEADQTQEAMYDESSGFCQTTYGGPGGDAFAASVGLPWGQFNYYNDVVINACEKSGGNFLNKCDCPAGKTYSKESGQCK